MKTSLSHLPKSKQTELNKICETIKANCADVEIIILFGSYARGNFKEEKDLKPDCKSGHASDYDILAITSKKDSALNVSLWNKISEECKKLNPSASPRIITHDIEALNIKLAEAQYFVTDVKKDGIKIFDSKKFEMANERNLTPKEKQRIAQEHFDYWFERATSFLDKFELMYSKGKFTDAAFDLHQVAESAYKSVLLVYSNYSPREHFLEFLGSKAEQYSELMKHIFARVSEEDEARFKLLEYAYIGGRYDPNYRISKEDLDLLSKDVKKLLELTKKVCEEKINNFSLIG